jgi:hypothetical protein
MLFGIIQDTFSINISRERFRRLYNEANIWGRIERRQNRIQRRVYNVKAPNYLWHIDGNHKLIKYKFVIHGGIDGKSRLITYLNVSSNNEANTVLSYFQQAIRTWGLPMRVRADKGGKNIEIKNYMNRARPNVLGNFIAGRSVHNIRIERLWRDLNRTTLYEIYRLLETLVFTYGVNLDDDLHMSAIHYVMLPRIQRKLDVFTETWNSHTIRGEGMSPL